MVTTIQDMASIITTLLVPEGGGFGLPSCVIKAKSQLNIRRKLTDDEITQLAILIHNRFMGMEIDDIKYDIVLSETMPGYSSGDTLPDGTIPDVVLPDVVLPDVILPDVILPVDTSEISIGKVIVPALGILLLWRLFK